MKRKIHVVTVHGKKKPYFDCDGYYAAIPTTAIRLQENRGIYPINIKPKFNDQGSALFEIFSYSAGYARELAKRLKKLKKYERIEFDSFEVDRQEINRLFPQI